MPQEKFFDLKDFRQGLWVLNESASAPLGSARLMRNVIITDRGGIAPRPGSVLLGSKESGSTKCRGFAVYAKQNGSQEIPIRAHGTILEYFDAAASAWATLKTGFTSGQEFDFREHLVNTENEDYVYFCNRYEPYQRWSGSITQLTSALVGGETAVPVASTLRPGDPNYTATATANSATTLDVAGTPWAASQWVNFYVHVTSGVHSGKVRKISASTSSQITFATLGSAPGNCTFDIVMLAFPDTGTIVYGGTTLAYTAVPTTTSFTVGSAHAAASGTSVTVVPTEYPANPRGNRLENYLARMAVGRVRSALSRDSGGALQGSTSAGSLYVSKLKNATDFTFAASRVAGEGDIISMPLGGGDITDVKAQEETLYTFKERYIESVSYSQDADDAAVRQPLKQGFGSKGRVVKGKDDIYFVTADNQITSVGRVQLADTTPQSVNIGLKIKRLIDTYDFSSVNGIEYKDRLLFACKSSPESTDNDTVLVYNRRTQSFEGTWPMPAFGFAKYRGDLYVADSNSPNVRRLFVGTSDVEGSDELTISATWASNFINLSSSEFEMNGVCGMAMEGYIRAGTTIYAKLYKDYNEQSPFLSFSFGGDETTFQDTSDIGAFLGSGPLGLSPLGTIGALGQDGRRHFQFIVYFPWQYLNFISYGLSSSGLRQDWEVTNIGVSLYREPSFYTSRRIKSIT